MTGILVIDKPGGWTSHDVVSKVKRTLGAKKVGHLGTLDPLATGVLPLVVDGATKYARLLEGTAKLYSATMKLGEQTDTYDSEGEVTHTREFAHISEADIRAAFNGFVGKISQVPPMYSSVKQKGVPLYKLARKGVVVERTAKEVEVISIEVTRIEPPYVDFTVDCTRGTYVRSLCNDIGELLGCGAHLTALRRLVSGVFTIDEAVAVEADAASLTAAIIPLGDSLRRSLAGRQVVEITAGEASRLKDSSTIMATSPGPFFAFKKPGEMVKFLLAGRIVAAAETVAIEETGEGDDAPAVFRVIKVLKGPASFAADTIEQQAKQARESVL